MSGANVKRLRPSEKNSEETNDGIASRTLPVLCGYPRWQCEGAGKMRDTWDKPRKAAYVRLSQSASLMSLISPRHSAKHQKHGQASSGLKAYLGVALATSGIYAPECAALGRVTR